MSKPSESRRSRLVAVTSVSLLGLAALLLELPLGAAAGIAAGSIDQAAAPGPAATMTPTAKALSNYQLRCWQYGKLLFDESSVSLPADARVGARLVAIDRYGQPLIITDAGSTTCQARAAGPAPATAPTR